MIVLKTEYCFKKFVLSRGQQQQISSMLYAINANTDLGFICFLPVLGLNDFVKNFAAR